LDITEILTLNHTHPPLSITKSEGRRRTSGRLPIGGHE
jgi:hypothetical protein